MALTPEDRKAMAMFEDLTARLQDLYTKVTVEAEEGLRAYFQQFAKDEEMWNQQLAAGQITHRQYNALKREALLQGEQWMAVRDRAALELTHTDELAAAMINGETPAFYAEAYNYGAFMTELQSAAAGIDLAPFTIYNEDAVRILMTENPTLLPPPLNIDIPKDLLWNQQHIQQAIAQGIVQGDSVDDVARRLQQVTTMDYNAAMRNARTASGAARSMGRDAAAKRAVENGIPMEKRWDATMDSRTRDSHLWMDGETVDIGEYFSNGLEYPSDPDGPPEEVYNCRCGYLTFIKGIDHDKDKEEYQDWMQENYYDDWLAQRQKDQRSGKAAERAAAIQRRNEIQKEKP